MTQPPSPDLHGSESGAPGAPSQQATARRLLLGVARDLLEQWREGYDWLWSAGRPPLPVSLEEAEAALALLCPEAREETPLRAVRSFLAAFFHAAQHGSADLDGLGWDEAVRTLQDLVVRLENDLPIEDRRVLRYAEPPPGCHPLAPLLVRLRRLRRAR